jgi:hypothetical protein
MPMDEPCKSCVHIENAEPVSKGYTIAGLCQTCKGTKWVSTNLERPLFKLLKENDNSKAHDARQYQIAPPDDELPLPTVPSV